MRLMLCSVILPLSLQQYYAAGAGAFMLLAGTASMFVGRRTPLLDGPLEGEAVDVEVKQELPVSQPGRTPTGNTQKTVDDKSEEKLDETIAAEKSDTEEKAPKKPGFFQRLWSKEPAPDEEEEEQQQEMEPEPEPEPKLEVPEPVDVDKKTETETEDDLPSSEDAKTETKRKGPFSFLTNAFSTPEPASEEAEEDKVGEDSLQPELEKAEAMTPEPKMEEFVAEIPKIVVEEPLTEVKADEVAASVTEEVADEVAIKTEDTEERKNLFSRLFANLSPGPPVSEKLEEKEAQTESEAGEASIAEPEKLIEEPVAKVKEKVVETVDSVISETKDKFPDIVPSVKDEKLLSDDVKAESVLENLTEDLTPPSSGLRERKRDMLARLVKNFTTSEEDSEESLEEKAEYVYVDEDGNELDPSAYAIDETGEAVQYVYVDEDGNEVDESTHRATTDADKDVAIVYVDEDGNEMDPSEYEVDENGETVTYVYVDEDGNEINPEDLEDDEDGDVSSGSKPKGMRKRDMISNFIQKIAEPVTSVLKGDKANEQENQRTEEELQELKEKRIQATFQKFYDRKL
uniref:Uncharacterized protein n=1 Tax=Rhodosorus marinus TaxID=101924 RepID=A0A7S2ZWI2_9RHOD|mmetsp:Transcript_33090/g.130036  ORF Transcript_33090/g.130036 Transcript_33090/m.130036 type:complete len:572 (+) Transcript_33090:881-2596(+)